MRQARKYYGQNAEDALLWAVFDKQETGCYIDVGAFDGIHLSNSYSFEQHGWVGICVEAHPDFYPVLARQRPKTVCVHAACVGPGQGSTVEFLTEPLGLLSGIQADQTSDMPQRYATRGMVFEGFQRKVVPAMTLDEIIEKCGFTTKPIDFLTMDVEGTELEALHGFGHDARVILVEANDEEATKKLHDYLASRGYTLGRTVKQNLFFARDQRDAEILRTARIDVYTEPTLHPLGKQATLAEHVGQHVCLG
jgi:FkbM family methyltransferase